MYKERLDVSQDYQKVFKLYNLAAKQGSAPAIRSLGLMYKNGHGVLEDTEKAAKHFTLAAAKEDSRSLLSRGFVSQRRCS